ncbi:hypothetical protein POJ06DRAFT_193469 [Lipomyces tetrasporus]|uniref:GRIP domain-containing protein n=1 Tax=Lipomyces tetrasporus TaxID=54092 RepID=A0AAD7QXC3_9ASCO|nr:uncharacterized protein POJ06DRAFT_193469 [Lipomyces tetrasporus]KAJ8102636.1 hypothetical protein POJ06DRAFT_193469 [Lipomyces tetrasporus]
MAASVDINSNGDLDHASSKVEREELVQKLEQLTISSKEAAEKFEAERTELLEKLAKAEKERHDFETQYKNLLGKVSSIRSTLGERLKTDSEEIARQKTRIEYLDQKCKNLTETVTTLQQEVITASDESDKLSKELASLRQSSISSHDSWQKERGELISKQHNLQKQLQEAQRSADDWRVIATEEKTMRIGTSERVAELEEQMRAQKSLYDVVLHENNENAASVQSLRQAINVMQEERKAELHDVVEKMQEQIDVLTDEKTELTDKVRELKSRLDNAETDLEKMRPFEKEVKEKTLLIGKLRHEAVILNEHLTKALRLLKKGTPDENVDRQLITNLLLSFLSLPRSDTKRFEILQLIAACLSWNEGMSTSPKKLMTYLEQLLRLKPPDQRTTAGLIRPGTSSANGIYT